MRFPMPPEGATVPVGSNPADPAAAAAGLTVAVDDATGRLRQTAAGFSDQQAREPSRLPGWSRGHLLTHLARNADGLRNLLIWARTGVVTPQYADSSQRESDIEAGAGRTIAELLADLDISAAALAAEARSLRPADWAAEVSGIHGAPHPAWFTLQRRLTEVEIHHVDLGAGYGPQDWPLPFTTALLPGVAAAFADDDVAAALLRCLDADLVLQIGPPAATPAIEISGVARSVLGWLTGRSDGAGLTATPAGQLPKLPPW
jgi:maleylpyruvate isomerase